MFLCIYRFFSSSIKSTSESFCLFFTNVIFDELFFNWGWLTFNRDFWNSWERSRLRFWRVWMSYMNVLLGVRVWAGSRSNFLMYEFVSRRLWALLVEHMLGLCCLSIIGTRQGVSLSSGAGVWLVLAFNYFSILLMLMLIGFLVSFAESKDMLRLRSIVPFRLWGFIMLLSFSDSTIIVCNYDVDLCPWFAEGLRLWSGLLLRLSATFSMLSLDMLAACAGLTDLFLLLIVSRHTSFFSCLDFLETFANTG